MNFSEGLSVSWFAVGVAILGLLLLAIALFSRQLPPLSEALVGQWRSVEFKGFIEPRSPLHSGRLSWAIFLAIADGVLLLFGQSPWLQALEFPLGIAIGINLCFVGFKVSRDLFNNYFLEATLEDRENINTERLTLGLFLMKSAIVLAIVFSFARAHQINLIGLVASLGVAGAAIAFASQKIVEQILWSIVLYIDRSFTVGDYIHLQDGNVGVGGSSWLAIDESETVGKKYIDGRSQQKPQWNCDAAC